MLRPLIEMFLLENKLRPSFVQSFALSTFPRGGRLYQRQLFKIKNGKIDFVFPFAFYIFYLFVSALAFACIGKYSLARVIRNFYFHFTTVRFIEVIIRTIRKIPVYVDRTFHHA